jgi:hypothetical protein
LSLGRSPSIRANRNLRTFLAAERANRRSRSHHLRGHRDCPRKMGHMPGRADLCILAVGRRRKMPRRCPPRSGHYRLENHRNPRRFCSTGSGAARRRPTRVSSRSDASRALCQRLEREFPPPRC